MLQRRQGRFRNPMEVVNEVFRQDYEHGYCYDDETLEAALTNVGFTEATATGYRQGAEVALQIDREDRAFESLYVEAMKP